MRTQDTWSSHVPLVSVENVNHSGNPFGNSYLSNGLPRYLPKRNENVCPQNSLHNDVHSSFTVTARKCISPGIHQQESGD